MFVERRRLIRPAGPARERVNADVVLANSKRLIEEIDVLLKRSRELTTRTIR